MQVMAPRVTAPSRRIETLRRLHAADITTGVMFASVIPMINDSEMETILEQASACGIESAGYVILRLPLEIKQLFRQWLQLHFPDRAGHVMSIIKQSRGGKEYDADFHQRLTGTGIFVDMVKQRFQNTC